MPINKSRKLRRQKQRRRDVIPLEKIPSSRMRLVFAILSFALFGLIGRMSCLQVLQAPALEARARAVQTHRTKPLGTRRSIIDRKGRV